MAISLLRDSIDSSGVMLLDIQSKLFKEIIAKSDDLFLAVGLNGVIMYLNRKASDVLGRVYGKLEGKSLIKFRLFGKNHLFEKFHTCMRDGRVVVFKDFSPLLDTWFQVKIYKVFDRMIIQMTNVSNLVETLERVKEVKDNFQSLVETIPQILWTAQPDGRIDYYNKRWYDFTGLNIRESLADDSWSKVLHSDDIQNAMRLWRDSVKKGKPYEIECRLKDGKNDVFRWFLGKAVPIKGENGKVRKWFGSMTDIDAQKKVESRKDEFISIASHELKTPITSLKGFSQIVGKYVKKDKGVEKYLDRMDAQIDRLSILVNELLDVSKVQSGKLDLKREYFRIDQLIEEVVEEVQHAAEYHKIKIKGKIGKEILADKYRVGQILVNLITNAIKYSPHAKQVLVNRKLKEGKIFISIKDFGIGISKRDLPRLFDRFFQASSRIRQSFSGLGLGLYISSEIAKRHSGKIEVKSKKGEGSTFILVLPLS